MAYSQFLRAAGQQGAELKSHFTALLAADAEMSREIEARVLDGILVAIDGVTEFWATLLWAKSEPGRQSEEVFAALSSVEKSYFGLRLGSLGGLCAGAFSLDNAIGPAIVSIQHLVEEYYAKLSIGSFETTARGFVAWLTGMVGRAYVILGEILGFWERP